jgi:hypothetical protein
VRGWMLAGLLMAGWAGVCLGQAAGPNPSSVAGTVCNESIADSAGYKILRVTPNVRWGAALAEGGPVKAGDAYTQANEALARGYVTAQLNAQDGALLAQLTRISARFVRSCTIVESADVCRSALGAGAEKCVTLRVDAYAVDIPATDVSGLNLSQPRSSKDTYLDGVPAALLALAPRAALGTDAALGTTVRISTETDLAQMVAAFRGATPAARPTARVGAERYRGQISADGFRALDADYYSGSLGFDGSLLLHGAVKQLSAEFRYNAELLPLGEEKLRSNHLTAGLSATVLAGWHVVRTVMVRGAYEHSANALSALGGSGGAGLHENGLLVQAATDGVFDTATVRSSVWFQRKSSVDDESYRKLVVRAGVERGLAVRAHQTVDLQVLGGYGRADGLVPAQDRFAGGNAGADFLDERPDSKSIESLPAGPIARSFGAGRLDWVGNSPGNEATSGSQSFGHVNVAAGIPIGLSKPLIPTFKVIGNATVADLLKARVDNDNLMEASLQAQGYSEADAMREQARVMNAIRPAVHYIADQANVWSVKPVVLFDWAGVRAGSGVGDSRFGAGGGVQFGVVTAKFQAAYIHSVGNGPSVGNFVFRLSFQNLF